MDVRNSYQNGDGNFIRKSPSRESGNYNAAVRGNDGSISPSVLLIGRDQNSRVYTDDVLRRAGFGVRAVAPSEAKDLVNDDGHCWPLVVFGSTLNTQDISEIGGQLRKRSPRSKLLLMLGPDPNLVTGNLFDATLESLEGPVALIRIARRLAEAAIEDGAA